MGFEAAEGGCGAGGEDAGASREDTGAGGEDAVDACACWVGGATWFCVWAMVVFGGCGEDCWGEGGEEEGEGGCGVHFCGWGWVFGGLIWFGVEKWLRSNWYNESDESDFDQRRAFW